MFLPNEQELRILSVASPFAMAIYEKNGEQAQAFLGRYGLDDWLDEHSMACLLLEFLGQDSLQSAYELGEETVMSALRRLRQFLMLRWIWQDALNKIALEALMFELSLFANVCITFAKDYGYHKLAGRYGEPMAKWQGKLAKDEFAVIAMGKLGAMELNLSSDIDLVFVHLGEGETNGKKSIENQKFMINLGRYIIKILDTNTADGFVFRVDMRLRPWGDGSQLVMTLPALQKYFNQHGRTWERFAWLKARVVNHIGGTFFEHLDGVIKNFVHRYYVDYTAFSALREMKSMIVNQQMQREDLDNVKLGMGGIRDIEFIVQSFALIYGGHHVILGQNLTCLVAIEQLMSLGYLKEDEGEQLQLAYRFLRRLEHAIQARYDEQTQRLPSQEDELMAIAWTLGFDDIIGFKKCLDTHREHVSIPFNRMVTQRQHPKQQPINQDEVENELSYLLDENSWRAFKDFMGSKLVLNLKAEARARLDTVYPILIKALLEHVKNSDVKQASEVVPRLLALMEAICRRSIYFVMLAENPNATVDLIPVLSKSSWIAKELTLHPMLLDDLLQKRYLYLPDKEVLYDILRQQLLRVERFDDEGYLGVIRSFKKTQVLAVATADILGLRHIMKVSDSLTFIAEVVLSSALYRAFDELSAKHGVPCLATGERATLQACGFAVVGYGKLGGLEMSYSSDLDVVFLHDINETIDTDGDKPISGMKFAMRLVQKVITYLTTQTRDGRAYELDMRLRPSGNAGVMVISVHGFDVYQNDKAWAWEHQALVRARGIVGDKKVLSKFDEIRQKVLTKPREQSVVREEVQQMRQKMTAHLGTKSNDIHQFHLKQDFGGLIDIEFLAQFVVLAYAHQYPNLAIWSDNVRIFEQVAISNIWTAERCQKLTETYLRLRQKTHELALMEKSVITYDEQFDELRDFVRCIWQEAIGFESL